MQKRKISILLLFLLFVVLAAGCGEKKKRITDGSEVYVKREAADTQQEPEEEEVQSSEEIYAITAIDMERRNLTLRKCGGYIDLPYEYTGGTYIKDKYGKDLTVSQLSVGELVTVELKGETLNTVQISKEAFSYDDLYNFTLDRDMQSLTVGGSVYYFDENLLAYYNGSLVPLSELSQQDTVCIKGVGQQIYTLQVTRGHGIVSLENVELFLGGYITIGNLLSQKITPQMRIEVAEGTYLLSVANNGYGGSREITVESNRETKVNLDELKGDGPKLCQVKFEIEPESAEVYLDEEQVDTGQAIQVSYGTHSLTAKAEGYVDWTRKLIVNSAVATIKIEMKTEEEAEEEKEETISTSDPSGSSGTDNNSNNNDSNDNNNSNNNNNNNNSDNNNSSNNNGNNSNNNNSNNNNSNNNNRNNNNNNNSNNNNSNNSANNNSNSTDKDINSFLEYIKEWVDNTSNKNDNSSTTNNNSNNNNTNNKHSERDKDRENRTQEHTL